MSFTFSTDRVAGYISLCLLLVLSYPAQRSAIAEQAQRRILDPDSSADISPRIINGQPSADFPAVGIVGSLSAGGFCSGTLIGSRFVLTAGHCAEFLLLVDNEWSGTFELDGVVYLTSRVFIHPGYDDRTLENDIAILELQQNVTDVAPLAIYRDAPYVGQELILVGYGSGGSGGSGADGTFGVKMVGMTWIDQVTPTTISWRFDDVNESNTAAGDSGGPALVDVNGQWLIAGVTSYGIKEDASLGDYSTDTRVDTYAGWIDWIIEASAADEDDEPSGYGPACGDQLVGNAPDHGAPMGWGGSRPGPHPTAQPAVFHGGNGRPGKNKGRPGENHEGPRGNRWGAATPLRPQAAAQFGQHRNSPSWFESTELSGGEGWMPEGPESPIVLIDDLDQWAQWLEIQNAAMQETAGTAPSDSWLPPSYPWRRLDGQRDDGPRRPAPWRDAFNR